MFMAIIECPYCNEIVEVESPDRFHISLSVKPVPKSFHGDIIRKEVMCENKDCEKRLS